MWPTGTNPTTSNAEIVRVTNISTDTFTITRTQEGTSARAIAIGDQFAATITVKTITDVEVFGGAAAATVATSETTTSTTYAFLTTTTDQVTVTVGANGKVLVGAQCDFSNSGAGNYCLIAVDVSGANTQAAADAVGFGNNSGTQDNRLGWTYMFTGLTAGSTTFKLKYRVTAGTGTFGNRHIYAVPL